MGLGYSLSAWQASRKAHDERILELACTVGLIVLAAFRWRPCLTILAATILAMESLVFIWVHLNYHEMTPLIMSGVLGLLFAFIAYGRMVLRPIH